MSIAGGAHRALERGRSIGCQAVQIFTRNQLRWHAPPLKEEEILLFRESKSRFLAVFAHTAYLINLASPDRTIFHKSVAGLAEELRRCRALGIELLVMHPGSHMGRGLSKGMRRLAQGVKTAYEAVEASGVTLALETTSGRGATLGGRFEHLRDLLGLLECPCGVCLDTCHVFSAGYELRDEPGYERTFQDFERTVSLANLRAIHLNDSLGELGSGVDRHAQIGQGKIGLSGFRLLVRDRRLRRIPAVLETPKGPDLREDVENLAVLRRQELHGRRLLYKGSD